MSPIPDIWGPDEDHGRIEDILDCSVESEKIEYTSRDGCVIPTDLADMVDIFGFRADRVWVVADIFGSADLYAQALNLRDHEDIVTDDLAEMQDRLAVLDEIEAIEATDQLNPQQ